MINSSPLARWALRIVMLVGLAFIYVPLGIVVINSFNASNVFAWPPQQFTTKWWSDAWHNPGLWDAVLTSVKIGVIATVVAMILGVLLSFALSRYEFFGRQTLSLLVILPIALPGTIAEPRGAPERAPPN